MKKLFLILSLLFLVSCSPPVTSFEECVAAGNPVMESFPRQCRDAGSGELFVEEIGWMNDGVILMQNQDDGSFACFGCNRGVGGRGLCVDPAPVMQPVDETPDRHCSDDFEIVVA